MWAILSAIFGTLSALFRAPSSEIALENLALRQQLAVYKRAHPRPRLTLADRAFWVVLARLSSDWRQALALVAPETVLRWHRQGFRYFWRWLSQSKGGRPGKHREVVALIRQIAAENRLWGAPRIHGELLKLGIRVAERTVARYMPRKERTPRGQSWKSFLKSGLDGVCALDFFVVPTATFRLLFGLVVIDLERRKIVHVNATYHPTDTWTALQLNNAFPFDSAPSRLLRDRDGCYGPVFQQRLLSMGIQQVVSPPRSPKANAFCERVIGSIRRECTDYMIVLGENHLRSVLRRYKTYYNGSRTHFVAREGRAGYAACGARGSGPWRLR